jgi:hypothetical protein
LTGHHSLIVRQVPRSVDCRALMALLRVAISQCSTSFLGLGGGGWHAGGSLSAVRDVLICAPRHQHDDDPDDDRHRGHDWHRNINMHSCPSDDLPWGRDRGARHRTHSPRVHRGGRCHGVVDIRSDVCGQSMSCSPGWHRARQSPRRDDEGRDRRRSVSSTHPMFHQHSTGKARSDGMNEESGVHMAGASRQMTLPAISEGKGVGSRTFPDLFVDSLATAVATTPTTDNFHSWMGMDPMLLETQGCTVGTHDTVSPDYTPVSAEWISPISEDLQTMV